MRLKTSGNGFRINIQRLRITFCNLKKKPKKDMIKANIGGNSVLAIITNNLRNRRLFFLILRRTGYFTIDMEKYYCGNTIYIMPIDDKYLLGILNSRIFFFYYCTVSS